MLFRIKLGLIPWGQSIIKQGWHQPGAGPGAASSCELPLPSADSSGAVSSLQSEFLLFHGRQRDLGICRKLTDLPSDTDFGDILLDF